MTELVKSPSEPDLEQTLLSTIACLGVEEARELAAGRSVIAPDLSTADDVWVKGREELECAVRDLYELVPTILTLRRGTMLDLERAQKELIQGNSADDRTQGMVTQERNESQRLVDTILDISQPFVLPASKADAKETVDDAISRVAKKEVEILLEYRIGYAGKLGQQDEAEAVRLLREFIQGT